MSTAPNELSLPQLNQKINELSSLVEKQSKLIGTTGQQLLQLQVKDVKAGLNDVNLRSKDQPQTQSAIDTSDFVTNEDIVQLVGELQNQLDFLEERTIRRTFNAQLTESSPEGVIAPICSKDGEFPNDDLWPNTIGDLIKFSKYDIILLCEFYELIIPNTQEQDLQKFIQSEQLDIKEAQKLLSSGQSKGTDLKSRVENCSSQEADDLFDELSRYIGVRYRKNKNTW